MEVYNQLKNICIERLTENNLEGTRVVKFSPEAAEQMHKSCENLLSSHEVDLSCISTHLQRRVSLVIDMLRNKDISGDIVGNVIQPIDELTFSATLHSIKVSAAMAKGSNPVVSENIAISVIAANALADALKEMNYTFNLPE